MTNPPNPDTRDRYLHDPNGNCSGRVESTVDDPSIVNGGCRAQDPEGLHWICYVGERDVEERIIDAELLGTFRPWQSAG